MSADYEVIVVSHMQATLNTALIAAGTKIYNATLRWCCKCLIIQLMCVYTASAMDYSSTFEYDGGIM